MAPHTPTTFAATVIAAVTMSSRGSQRAMPAAITPHTESPAPVVSTTSPGRPAMGVTARGVWMKRAVGAASYDRGSGTELQQHLRSRLRRVHAGQLEGLLLVQLDDVGRCDEATRSSRPSPRGRSQRFGRRFGSQRIAQPRSRASATARIVTSRSSLAQQRVRADDEHPVVARDGRVEVRCPHGPRGAPCHRRTRTPARRFSSTDTNACDV